VRDNGLDAGFVHASPEQGDLLGGKRARAPLPRRLGEDLESIAPAGHRAIDRPRQSACNRQVRA
jgi:hypothetical protein